ncbi:single-stranded DNA-binding protein [Falsirhodobacter xinxiangensis]|uniref:single-stranded DNA-binding protein n=1 Tax=Falsirhodobacter xinxiangensis TaxID=2530049 RepID=UPI0010AB4CE7|nr:single-stranded DNA-binding protein [Rhodobacter xinxiangensis]
MKSISIAGNIGKDAVTRSTQNGDKVTGWSVAVEERVGQEKRTLWFDVSLWGNRGEKLAQYLTKGTRVAVSGEFSTREHEGKTYLTIRANEVTLLGGGEQRGERQDRDGGGSRGGDGYGAGGRPSSGGRSTDFDDGEIPF